MMCENITTLSVRKLSDTTAPPFPKPCLKRRSSVPANSKPPQELMVEERLRHGSCDSLDNSSSSISSSYSSSLGSKKSVSFADSIGEDLCRVKLFRKDLCELTLLMQDQEVTGWPEKMWRWQQQLRNGSGDWYLGDDEEEELYDDFDEDFFSFNPITTGEEDQDEFTQEQEVVQMERALSCLSATTCSSSSIVPTFVQPVDLPGFDTDSLAVVGLETVAVLPDQSMLSGTVRIGGEGGNKVGVRYSFDGWSTSEDVSATSFGGRRFGFVIATAAMRIGEDLELVAYAEDEGGRVWEDDNGGLKYRFICKSRDKFRPGKSLW